MNQNNLQKEFIILEKNKAISRLINLCEYLNLQNQIATCAYFARLSVIPMLKNLVNIIEKSNFEYICIFYDESKIDSIDSVQKDTLNVFLPFGKTFFTLFSNILD